LKGNIWSTNLLRLGFYLRTLSANPVTVSVAVYWAVDPPDYQFAMDRMRSRLDEEGFKDVEVEFERGEIEIWTDFFA
jgi:hypothetical protein